PEALAFDQCRLAVRADGLDDQVHVRVHPVEPRDGPFDQYFLRLIEHGLAVMGESRRTERHGRCCEKVDSRRAESHVETSEQASTAMINDCARRGIPGRKLQRRRERRAVATGYVRFRGNISLGLKSPRKRARRIAASPT